MTNSSTKEPPRLCGERGFTLVEMTLVLVIIGLLISSLIPPLSAQIDQRNVNETREQLAEIREALIGFSTIKGFFPCPAKSTSSGDEDRNTSTGKCQKRYGLLPWTTLGVKPSDGWGHLFIYSVSSDFSDQKITLSAITDITIKTRDSAGNLSNLSNDGDIPVVVLSTGKNGYLSWSFDQPTQNPDSTTANDDEDVNAVANSNGKIFVSRDPTPSDLAMGEFDDIVTWISPYILFNRMIAAGKLP